jgi:YqaJ-like recombinase protein
VKIVECQQGTPAWALARSVIPTASCFDRILTSKTLEPSAQAAKYMHELLAAWLIGRPLEEFSSGMMSRGTGLEAQARSAFAFEMDLPMPETVGLVTNDDGTAGASPDGLVRPAANLVFDAGLELKAPGPAKHVAYMLDPLSLVAEYRHQIQGGLFITGFPRWFAMSFHPSLPPVIEVVEPDPPYQAELGAALQTFTARYATARARLLALGCVPRDPKANAANSEAALMGSF